VISATKIQNCIFDKIKINGGGTGIYIKTNSCYNIIQNCTIFNNSSYSIRLETSLYNRIYDNNIFGTNNYGIFLEATSTNNNIIGNMITNCATSGIEEDTANDDYSIFTNNQVIDSGASIVVSGANTIQSNNIS
jgi:parallel beta-helix repeat protein